MPFFLMGGALGALGGLWMNKSASDSDTGEAKIMGVNATTVGVVGGVLMALMGGAFLGPAGLALAVASLTSRDATARAKEGIDTVVAAAVQKHLDGRAPGAPAPPALPGPAAKGAGLLAHILPSFGAASEA